MTLLGLKRKAGDGPARVELEGDRALRCIRNDELEVRGLDRYVFVLIEGDKSREITEAEADALLDAED